MGSMEAVVGSMEEAAAFMVDNEGMARPLRTLCLRGTAACDVIFFLNGSLTSRG